MKNWIALFVALFAFSIVSYGGEKRKVHVLKGKAQPTEQVNNGRGDPHDGCGNCDRCNGTTSKAYDEYEQGPARNGVIIVWLVNGLSGKRHAVKLMQGQKLRVYSTHKRAELIAGSYRRVFYNMAEIEFGRNLRSTGFVGVRR